MRSMETKALSLLHEQIDELYSQRRAKLETELKRIDKECRELHNAFNLLIPNFEADPDFLASISSNFSKSLAKLRNGKYGEKPVKRISFAAAYETGKYVDAMEPGAQVDPISLLDHFIKT